MVDQVDESGTQCFLLCPSYFRLSSRLIPDQFIDVLKNFLQTSAIWVHHWHWRRKQWRENHPHQQTDPDPAPLLCGTSGWLFQAPRSSWSWRSLSVSDTQSINQSKSLTTHATCRGCNAPLPISPAIQTHDVPRDISLPFTNHSHTNGTAIRSKLLVDKLIVLPVYELHIAGHESWLPGCRPRTHSPI